MEAAIESLTDPSASSSTPSPSSLLVPTQRRYLSYYQHYLSKGLPEEIRKLGLVKVVCHGRIPKYHAKPSDSRSCRPYVQVFQKGELIHTTTGPEDSQYEVSPQDLRLYDSRDTTMEFAIGCNITGDVTVRMRHFQSLKKRITMARFGFHTSFIDDKGEGNSFRLVLSRDDLDVACRSERFDKDFKMELVFGEVKEAPKPEPKPQVEAQQKASTASETGREKEEDIQDLESRLHQVLEDITSDEDIEEKKDEKVKTKTPASSSPEGEDGGFGDLLVDEDDDGEKLLAALHAELDDE
uniref:C2 tensin-type domain-containing protein n=1 Tax=Lotharella oceanica TaxID=641309 RepID=A0A7S2U5I6_9EUKA